VSKDFFACSYHTFTCKLLRLMNPFLQLVSVRLSRIPRESSGIQAQVSQGEGKVSWMLVLNSLIEIILAASG
jgi:hypothetical protein